MASEHRKQYMLEYARNWRKANKNKVSGYRKKYLDNNWDKHLEYLRNYRAKNPRVRIENNIRWGMWASIKTSTKRRKWEKLVGYTTEDLMKHLEKKFTNGMSWDNYGEWHIDHIKPKRLFEYKTDKDLEFKKCWELTNLQPLWAKDNFNKHAEYE